MSRDVSGRALGGRIGDATPFTDLNWLLDRFVSDVRAVLGASFVGAYLQGSFALGDADVHSDVDFVVVTSKEVTNLQLAALQAMHKEIHGLDMRWAKHLEGSYIPSRRLRRVDPTHRPFLFLDNGADELVRDPHCNTAVVRWILRERGVRLAGPDPVALIVPVGAADLRREARLMLRDYADWALESGPASSMSEWKQTYLVVTFCRILHTLQTGTIGSKRLAGNWALETVNPGWQALIRRALDDRADPWGRVDRPTDPALRRRTLAFARYAVACAQRRDGTAAASGQIRAAGTDQRMTS